MRADASATRYLSTETFAPFAAGEVREVPHGAVVVPKGCFLDVNGMHLREAGPGRALARMKVGAGQLNQAGVVQGGLIGAFADAVAGWAALTALDSQTRFSTVAFSVNLVKAAREGSTLRGEAEVIHAGRSSLLISVRVTDEASGHIVAVATCSQLVLRPVGH